jgi:hypothetical protein
LDKGAGILGLKKSMDFTKEHGFLRLWISDTIRYSILDIGLLQDYWKSRIWGACTCIWIAGLFGMRGVFYYSVVDFVVSDSWFFFVEDLDSVDFDGVKPT